MDIFFFRSSTKRGKQIKQEVFSCLFPVSCFLFRVFRGYSFCCLIPCSVDKSARLREIIHETRNRENELLRQIEIRHRPIAVNAELVGGESALALQNVPDAGAWTKNRDIVCAVAVKIAGRRHVAG